MAEKLIPLEDAQAIVLSHVNRTEVVEIPVWQAVGLPLAEDAVADIDISPFANSAMDGYAVRSSDLAQASGRGAGDARPLSDTRPRAMCLRAQSARVRRSAS